MSVSRMCRRSCAPSSTSLPYVLGADSLEYLSVEGLIKAVRWDIKIKHTGVIGHCTACLTGEYPGGIPEDLEW